MLAREPWQPQVLTCRRRKWGSMLRKLVLVWCRLLGFHEKYHEPAHVLSWRSARVGISSIWWWWRGQRWHNVCLSVWYPTCELEQESASQVSAHVGRRHHALSSTLLGMAGLYRHLVSLFIAVKCVDCSLEVEVSASRQSWHHRPYL